MADPAPLPPGPTIIGRLVVVGFLACALVAGVVATVLRYSQQDRIRNAQLKVMPTLAADVAVTCDEPALGPVELRRRGRCSDSGTLLLVASAPGEGTKTVLYALLSGDRAEAGALEPGHAVKIPLAGRPAGPCALAVVMSDSEVKPAALQRELDARPATDVRERLTAVEAFVSRIIQAGGNARAERLAFQLENGTSVH